MAELFTLGNFVDLLLLIMLQAVLGFDNLLYISLESQRAPEDKQKAVRFWGITIAVGLRIVLLFLLLKMIEAFREELFSIHWTGVIEASFNLHSLIVLFGGIFILYTAMKEILHMMTLEELDHGTRNKKSMWSVVFWIVSMNVVFSFDSILSAMAISNQILVMGTAIVIGGILMIMLADTVTEFIQKNRMYEVMGLFILFLVGVMLLSEGGHLSHLTLFGNEVHQMTKTTFYFVLVILVISDIVQSRYQKKLNLAKEQKQTDRTID